MQQQLLSSKEAAIYLGTRDNTLKTSRHTGLLWQHPAPAYIKIQRTVRYRKETLDEWLDALPEEKASTSAK